MKESSSEKLIKVSASAGSGKTYSLTQRFLSLLFEGTEDVNFFAERKIGEKQSKALGEILAVTFTNLAATQMQERILSALKDIALGQESEGRWDKDAADAMLEYILRRYSQLNIRTIDSFIYQLVRLSSLDLGLSPEFEVRLNNSEILEGIFNQVAHEAIEDKDLEDIFIKSISSILYNTDTFKGFLGRIKEYTCEVSENILKQRDCFTLSQQELVELKKEMDAFLDVACKTILEAMTQSEVKAKALFLKALEARNFGSVFFEKNSIEECLNKGSLCPSEEICSLFKQIQPKIKNIILLENALKYTPLLGLVEKLLERLPEEERVQNAVFMLRLYQFASSNLEQEHGVSEAFCRMGARLSHILFDEFQDTSPEQWKAIFPLAEEALSKGGSTFFVGDGKQAIYGWRGGDSKLFKSAPKELTHIANLHSHNLETNWRSSKNIVDWNNAFFKVFSQESFWEKSLDLLMPETIKNSKNPAIISAKDMAKQECMASLIQAYGNAEQYFSGKNLPEGVVQVHEVNMKGKSYDAYVLGLLPLMLKKLHMRYDWNEICVLTYTNSQGADVANCLLSQGIPVVTSGSLFLEKHPIIQELVALLGFLANPSDDAAFWQLLHSGYILPYSLPEKVDLYDFAVKRGKDSICQAFQKQFPQIWEDMFSPFYDKNMLMSTYDTMQYVYDRWQLVLRYKDENVFLLRFLELIYLAEEKGFIGIVSFLDWWEEKGTEERAPLSENSDAVKIMTVHKAKGLESEVVLVPWHNFRVSVDSKPQIIEFDIDEVKCQALGSLIKEHGKAYWDAFFFCVQDSINALYVAWTRARTELYCFIPAENKESSGPGKRPEKFHHIIHGALDAMELRGRANHESWCGINSSTQEVFEEESKTQGKNGILEPLWLNTLDEYFSGEEMLEGADAIDTAKYLTECIEKQESFVEGKKNHDVSSHHELVTPSLYEFAIDRTGTIGTTGTGMLTTTGTTDIADIATDSAIQNKLQNLESVGSPANWLPSLKIFRTNMEDLMGLDISSPAKRGTFIHACLEYMVITGNPEADARRAEALATRAFPHIRLVEEDFLDKLIWFASLEEAPHWLSMGRREHALIGRDGRLLRMDMLVPLNDIEHGESFLVIDYKTGNLGHLPSVENVEQVQEYMRLLHAATQKPVSGLLIYLDQKQLCPVSLLPCIP